MHPAARYSGAISSRASSSGGRMDEGVGRRAASRYEPQELDDDQLWAVNVPAGPKFDELLNNPDATIQSSGHNDFAPLQHFEDAAFQQILMDNIHKANHTKPTAIQKYAIPVISAQQDLMACAQTGSGKTGAYLLPLVNDLLTTGDRGAIEHDEVTPICLVMSPTRELAKQIYEHTRKYTFGTTVSACVLYGGTGVEFQMEELRQKRPSILVATVGRLNQFLQEGKLSFRRLKYLVLDEADRMLEAANEQDIRAFIQHQTMPAKGVRRTIMVSATFSTEIQKIAHDFLHEFTFVSVGALNMANHDVNQEILSVSKFQKETALIEHVRRVYPEHGGSQTNAKMLIFVERKRTADYLAVMLSAEHLKATSIHGDRDQRQREEAFADFRSGAYPILLATAVCARGIDIPHVDYVINYDLPQTIEEYVHRIGRTARVGNSGSATSFFDSNSDNDRQLAAELIDVLVEANQVVPGFLRQYQHIRRPMHPRNDQRAPQQTQDGFEN